MGLGVKKRAVGLASLLRTFLVEDRSRLLRTMKEVGIWCMSRIRGGAFAAAVSSSHLWMSIIGPDSALSIEPGYRMAATSEPSRTERITLNHLTNVLKVLTVVQHAQRRLVMSVRSLLKIVSV